jgi:hypothetical protein
MKFFFSKKENGQEVAEEIVFVKETLDFPGTDGEKQNVAAAIGLALHMYMDHVREHEKAVLTFQKIMKPYSPWSSKIFGLRQMPMYMPNLKRR